MKKLLSLMTVVVLSVSAAFAGEVNIVMADHQDLYGEADKNGNLALDTIDFGDATFIFAKNNGSSSPNFNLKGNDARLYAKGTLTISAEETITSMVFNLSAQGLKRAAEITASVGQCVVDAEAKTVTWTGAATEVVLTVGDKAVYGSEGAEKAGQFCFESVSLVLDGDVDPSDALEVVDAQNFVTIVNDALVVNADGNVQVYNVLGKMLYNGAGNTIYGLQQGQILVVRAGGKATKIVF